MRPRISCSRITIRTRISRLRSQSDAGRGQIAANSRHRGAVSATQRYLLPTDEERTIMLQKVTTVVLIATALVLAACNTVRGAARDVNSVANCTENAING